MMNFKPIYPDKFVDRGDPAAFDFTSANFPAMSTWTDLDLSGIIPIGTKAIVISTLIRTNTAGKMLIFRCKGNVNDINVMTSRSVVIAQIHRFEGIVNVDSNRFIQYWQNIATGYEASMLIKGWFI